MSQETISCEGFLCKRTCNHCSKYIVENPAVVNLYGGFHKYIEGTVDSNNSNVYIEHIMKRLISITNSCTERKSKVVSASLLLDFLLKNYSYLKMNNNIAATAITKLNVLETIEYFSTYASERGIRADLWRQYFMDINEKMNWKNDFICDGSCVHCQRFLETEPAKYLYLGVSRNFTKTPIDKNDGDEYLEHIFRRLEHLKEKRRNYNKVLVEIISAEIGLSNFGFLRPRKRIALNILNFLSGPSDLDRDTLVKDADIDIMSWIGYLKDICFTPKRTDHEDLIYKTELEPGERYVECSFTDEHVVNYEFIKTFQKTDDPNNMKCPYCTNNIKDDIYEQI